MSLACFHKVVEERIAEAQRDGLFDNLPGKGKPLALEDGAWVPEDLRVAYRVLKNAHLLPPEAELRRELYQLEDLLKHIECAADRKTITRQSEQKMIRLDLLKRRSFSLRAVQFYGKKVIRKFYSK